MKGERRPSKKNSKRENKKYPYKKTRKEKIKGLETKMLLMGLNGMAYSGYWNRHAKKLNKLKDVK